MTSEPPRLAHLAILVRRLEDAEAALRISTGLAVERREDVPSEGVRVGFVPVGSGAIELVQPVGAGGPLGRFLDERGEAVHHVALAVPDVIEAMSRARGAGLRLLDSSPRIGAGGTRVAFVHPRSAHGLLIELVERREP
jgi:methylmalonyl-CoA epimerase